MLLQRKIDRAMKWARERRKGAQEAPEVDPNQPEKPEDLPLIEDLVEKDEHLTLEKGDLKAMMLAGLLTILPVCLLALLLICLLGYLLMGGFGG